MLKKILVFMFLVVFVLSSWEQHIFQVVIFLTNRGMQYQLAKLLLFTMV